MWLENSKNLDKRYGGWEVELKQIGQRGEENCKSLPQEGSGYWSIFQSEHTIYNAKLSIRKYFMLLRCSSEIQTQDAIWTSHSEISCEHKYYSTYNLMDLSSF